MLDDRNDSASALQMAELPIRNRQANEVGWAALLGDARGGQDVSPYAAPARAADLSALPLPGTGRSVLGRETSLQKVRWTDDGWLELATGGTLAGETTEGPSGLPATGPPLPRTVHEDFDASGRGPDIATLRVPATPDWADLSARPGWVRLRGRDSLFPRFDVSLLAVRLQGFIATATTLVDFEPEHFSHAAGLTVFYDDRNWCYLRVYASESLGTRALGILEAEHGRRREHVRDRLPLPDGPVVLRAEIETGTLRFSWHPTSAAADPYRRRLRRQSVRATRTVTTSSSRPVTQPAGSAPPAPTSPFQTP